MILAAFQIMDDVYKYTNGVHDNNMADTQRMTRIILPSYAFMHCPQNGRKSKHSRLASKTDNDKLNEDFSFSFQLAKAGLIKPHWS